MPYFVIEDFRGGLDARRLPDATPPGSLTQCKNAVVNRGGEIQKVKKFSIFSEMTAGTFGLAGLGDDLYVFGSGADPGGHTGLTYQRLQNGANNMTRLANTESFGGALAAIADYDNGDRVNFHDGTAIAGFATGSGTAFEDLVTADGMLTWKNKLNLLSGSNLLLSKSGDASIFDEAETGSGLIDLSAYISGGGDLIGLGAYQQYLAVLSTQNIAIWETDPDIAQYNLLQVLPNIGTLSAKSVQSFGEHDLFFVSPTGIRSLRAINSSLAAGINDVGTPIDPLIIDKLAGMDAEQKKRIDSAIEPVDGRYMTAIDDTVYAFSYFPGSKVAAWSTISPGFDITDFARAGDRLYARSGDTVYLYGGAANDEYTDQEVVVELPYMDARMLATAKKWTEMDAVLTGRWDVYVNAEVNNPDYWKHVATLSQSTTSSRRLGLADYGQVLKMKFVHRGEGNAVLSKIVLHYEKDRT